MPSHRVSSLFSNRSPAPLLHAASAPNLNHAARLYRALGFSVIPLRGKVPDVKWRDYQQRLPTERELEQWAQRGLFRNVGIVCGEVSGDLVVLDFDAPEIYQDFAARFPALAHTYTVATGGGGRHVYLYVSCLPPSRRGQKLELCANGRQVVAPPSIHPDTKQPYRVIQPQSILQVVEVNALLTWMSGEARASPPASRNSHPPEPPATLKLLVAAIGEHLHSLGYQQQGEWLTGQCIYPERHTHGDRKSSFGFNTRTGYGNCFRCGSMRAKDIAAVLKLTS